MNMRKLRKTYNNDKKKKKKNVNLSQYFRGVAWDFEGVRTAWKLGAPKAVGGGGGGSLKFAVYAISNYFRGTFL